MSFVMRQLPGLAGALAAFAAVRLGLFSDLLGVGLLKEFLLFLVAYFVVSLLVERALRGQGQART